MHGMENYQGAKRTNENELEDMYQRFYLMPKKRKMLKACMSVLKLTRSRKLVDQVLVSIVRSYDESTDNLKEKAKANKFEYEDLDPYLKLYLYCH